LVIAKDGLADAVEDLVRGDVLVDIDAPPDLGVRERRLLNIGELKGKISVPREVRRRRMNFRKTAV
jgi:hypothetical protein